MLWGHPALLALTVLARPGATLVVDDLPFHHHVDADGDVVALPCTERLISANVASLLREAGINAVMAHKGEPLVRFNGLEAVNGDGLAVAGAAPKPARGGDARFAVQSRIDAKAAQAGAGFAPTLRRGGAVPATADDASEEPAQEAEADEAAEEPAEAPPDEAAQGTDESTTGEAVAEAKAPDDELAALLSSLEEPPAAAAAQEEPDKEAPMDPDLAALLKSLG
jgi:type VI secretion system protein ImpC